MKQISPRSLTGKGLNLLSKAKEVIGFPYYLLREVKEGVI
jgi:hypothetical protein